MTTVIISPGSGGAAARDEPPGQAHALRAAAAFVEDAGMPHLTAAVCGDGEVRLIVDERAGPAAARIHAVAALATRAGAGTPAWCALTRGLRATGHLDGHRLTIVTFIHSSEPEGEQP